MICWVISEINQEKKEGREESEACWNKEIARRRIRKVPVKLNLRGDLSVVVEAWNIRERTAKWASAGGWK